MLGFRGLFFGVCLNYYRLFGSFFLNKAAEQRLAILAELDHASKNIYILVGLTSRSTALALYFHDKQLRMHLHEHAFALNDFRTSHVCANAKLLAYILAKRVMDVADNLCLLCEIHIRLFFPLWTQ